MGIMGWPIEHSLSPAMHNAAFAALGLDWVYVPLPVAPDQVREAVQGLRALGFVGASVTIPHKQAVMPWLDEMSAAARAIGAVNTLVVRDGRLLGENTDWLGFLASLREAGVEPAGRRALVLGAGGAARAVVYALASVGAKVVVVNRTHARAEKLVEELSQIPGVKALAGRLHPLAAEGLVPGELDLVVNTTSVGMWPRADESPWPEGVPLPAAAVVCDLVYNPLETQLLKSARSSGCRVIDGLGMLVHQGAAAFELWTGVEAPVKVMREELMRHA
ncbi:MAG: shikimate dehydrogenase [Chloroflexi bacterium RBG_16_57_9]|nr:MAG: shikimate dehydrogenase [Chloroflexi bacterium RBG_16_57_9]